MSRWTVREQEQLQHYDDTSDDEKQGSDSEADYSAADSGGGEQDLDPCYKKCEDMFNDCLNHHDATYCEGQRSACYRGCAESGTPTFGDDGSGSGGGDWGDASGGGGDWGGDAGDGGAGGGDEGGESQDEE